MSESVNSYLWDKTGAASPDVEQLESLLAGFRYQPQPLAWERAIAIEKPRSRFFVWRWPVAIAAAALLLIAVALRIQSRFVWQAGEPWRVATVAGTPRIADAPFAGSARLPVGQILETDASSRARLRVADLGVIDVEPDSRIRLMATTAKKHTVALDYGTISARMWAPPFSLSIETPSAALFDLGCAFTLHTEPNGYATAHVTSGWIEFEGVGWSSLVPSGAEVISRPGIGPGLPYFSDASAEFRLAIADFDSHPEDAAIRAAALDRILRTARHRDAYTLLNLFDRVTGGQRASVLDRLASLVPIPDGYTRDDVLARRRSAMNAYWDAIHAALHLNNPKSWVMNWKDVLNY